MAASRSHPIGFWKKLRALIAILKNKFKIFYLLELFLKLKQLPSLNNMTLIIILVVLWFVIKIIKSFLWLKYPDNINKVDLKNTELNPKLKPRKWAKNNSLYPYPTMIF